MSTLELTYHVVPYRGRWAVKRSGSRRATLVCDAKSEAIARGRALARLARADLIVHNADGRLANPERLLRLLTASA